jgi:ABC-type nitrate/sulfonate/bicarbonate transport system permease component
MRRHERLIVAAGALGFLALWEALVRLGRVDASLAPAPTTILKERIWQHIRNAVR